MDPSVQPDRYRGAWTWAWRAVIAVGLVAAAFTWPVAQLLAAFWVGGVFGAVAAGAVLAGRAQPLRARPLVAGAAWGATGLAATLAVAEPQPLAALGLLALAVASCPSLVARLTYRTAPAPLPGSTPLVPHRELLESPESVVGTLPTATLCALWRDTGTWLSQSPAVSTQLSVVSLRGMLIDELERRFPERAAAWLQAEGVASSDPARFLG